MSTKEKLKPDTSMFYHWGFWWNGMDVHPYHQVVNIQSAGLVVTKRDSHGDMTMIVAPKDDSAEEAKKTAINAFNLGFTEANSYILEVNERFWFVLQQWLEWKKDQKVAILAIRVWFSDGRVEDVGSVPQ